MKLTEWELEVAKTYIHCPIRFYLEDTDDSDYECHSDFDGFLHQINNDFLELCNGEKYEHEPSKIILMRDIEDIRIWTGGRRIEDENRGWWWQPLGSLCRWIQKKNFEEMQKELEIDRLIAEGKIKRWTWEELLQE